MSAQNLPHLKTKKIPQQNSNKGKWHWSLTTLIASGFIGTIGCGVLYNFILISSDIICILIIAVGTLTFFAQLPYFKQKGKIINEKYVIGLKYYALYNYIGLGTLITSLILLFNLLIHEPPYYINHKVVSVNHEQTEEYGAIVFNLEDDAFQDRVKFRRFYNDVEKDINNHPYIRYEFSKGLFGFENIGKRFLTNTPTSQHLIEAPYITQ